LGLAALGAQGVAHAENEKPIPGLERVTADPNSSKDWKPISDRKIRVGIAGYGVCKFGAEFGFQHHPNVEVVAVSDLYPDRRDGLAKACKCSKTYDSLEEMVKDDSIEAIFCATDAPSHARLCIEALNHGKHVATCVPAVWGSLEEADQLFETVKKTGLKYMMFETSSFYEDLYAMRQIYNAGLFGKIVYSEGEYFHYMPSPIDSYKDWRIGNPPQWYPTHSNAYYISVTGGSFTEVSCEGMPSVIDFLKPENNAYKNPFGTEAALFRTSEGGMSRMLVSWDTPGDLGMVMGRIRGQKAAFYEKFIPVDPNEKIELPNLARPPLPPGVEPGGHNGSQGHLMNEFVTALLEDRTPLVDITQALNLTVAGVVAHQSAMRDGETMKIPQYVMPDKNTKKA
jgi:predicted dehydrogenase